MADESNGSSPDADEWREHNERYEAVRALERRLGAIETAVVEGQKDIMAALRGIRDDVRNLRGEQDNVYMDGIKLTERVAALETRLARKPRKARK